MNYDEFFSRLDLRSGEDIDHRISRLEGILKELGPSPFSIGVSSSFTNAPDILALEIDNFIESVPNDLCVFSVYAEMNGFGWNFDDWNFCLSAYTNHGGISDTGWLANPSYESPSSISLAGMDRLRGVFEKYAGEDEFELHSEVCSILVILKFQKLIGKSAFFLKHRGLWVVASSHDYDSIVCSEMFVSK